MIFKSTLGAVSACIITISFSSISEASLIGDTIYASGSGLSPTSATIGNDIEFIGIRGSINFDFAANTLIITHNGDVFWSTWGDYVFSDFDTEITGVSITENIGFGGSVVDRFSFTSDSITLDMQGSSRALGEDAILVFDIETATVVPIPSAVWLFGSGLIGLIGFARRKTHS